MAYDWRAEERKRHIEDWQRAYVRDGVVRWQSNDRVPPADIRKVWVEEGFEFDPEVTDSAYHLELRQSLKSYAEARERNGYSDEERAEMLNAFGSDADVVDVITGKRIKL